jgi:regulator of PEP synthase PpsR (kinase-PPPase family)
MANEEQARSFKVWQEEAKQDANDRATTMATAIENHALEVQTRLAQFEAAQTRLRDEAAAQAALERDQRKADNDAQLAVLQAMLQAQTQNMAQASQLAAADLLGPIIADMQQNSALMMQQLAQGLSGLHTAHSSPLAP